MEGNEEFISSDSAPTRSLGGQQQFIGMRVVSSDDRHRVNHIRILQFAVHPPRACPGLAMREQPICRSAATPDADLAVQHTTGAFWAGCFSLWALGYGVCLFGRSVRPTWRFVWRRSGSVETTCGDISPTMTWFVQGMWQSRGCWLIVWKLAATLLGIAWLRWRDAT